MTDDAGITVTERWLFAGSRVGHNGKRVHAWWPIDHDGTVGEEVRLGLFI